MQGCVPPDEFLRTVRPALACGDPAVLAQVVARKWEVPQLCPLVFDPNVDVRRVAAITLGLVGDHRVTGCLVRALSDADDQVNEMAEQGLWSIWLRACSPRAAETFRQGMQAMADEDFQQAADLLEKTIAIDPDFTEAYHQCGMAHYLLEHWQAAIAMFLKALDGVPMHFGAVAGLGHCYVETRRWRLALQCYRRALRINPRMPAVSQSVAELEERIRQRNDSSGMFEFREISV